MGRIVIPSSTSSSATNIVKYLKVGTSGCSIYIGEVKVSPSDEDINAMSAKCLTLVAWEDTTFTFTPTNGQVLSYSVDGGAYTALPSTGGSVSVSGGQQVSWSGTAVPVASSSTVTTETDWGIGKFSSTGKYHVEGNAMSLLYGPTAFKTQKTLSGKNYALVGLFSGSTTLMTAEHMLLPAETLAGSCYRSLFKGCTNMRKAPELPATTLVGTCYLNIFYNCSNLLEAPKLPATTLTTYCYYQMFYGCSKITKAPELPAMIVPGYAYYGMFRGCSSLEEAPELPATTFTGSRNYTQMFYGCTKITNTPKLPVKTLTAQCYRYMFYNCDKLTEAPTLEADVIPASGCSYMFNNCNGIKEITCLATNISAVEATLGWFSAVTQSGTFIKDASMTGWTTGADGIPSNWTIKDCYKNVKYPLTFIARENCTFTFSAATNTSNALQYSTNKGSTWTALPATGVSVASGGAIMFRGSCVSNGSSGSTSAVPIGGIGKFGSTGSFDIEGNIMSLLYNDNFSGQTSLVGADIFALLFASTPVVNAENLILPATTLTNYCYLRMFNNCTSLITTPKLLAENLTNGCYYYMFQGCSSLVDAPELPSMSLSGYCYQGMFNNCSSLVNAPKLPATTLATRCYRYMFQNCTSLIEAPELIAKTVSISGYSGMFQGCTNLKYIKCLATDISATDCTSGWTNVVATGGTFVKDPEMTGWTRSTTGIPTTWKDSDYLTFIALEDGVKFRFNYPISKESTNKLSYSLDDGETWIEIASTIYTPPLKKSEKIRWKGTCVPVGNNIGIGNFESTGKYEVEGNVMSLLYGDNYATQTSLAGKNYVFVGLFRENLLETKPQIHNLVNAENLILPATTLSIGCYMEMFGGCLLLERSPKVLPAMTLENDCYYSMFFRCETMATAPKLPATTLAEDCYFFMFYMCELLATAPELPATTLAKECYGEMFEYCTSLTTAPELPATTLVDGCYSFMFQWCPNLNYIKAMFTTTPGEDYTLDWVRGVASSGTFVKNANATWNVSGVNGIPTNWTIQTETP